MVGLSVVALVLKSRCATPSRSMLEIVDLKRDWLFKIICQSGSVHPGPVRYDRETFRSTNCFGVIGHREIGIPDDFDDGTQGIPPYPHVSVGPRKDRGLASRLIATDTPAFTAGLLERDAARRGPCLFLDRRLTLLFTTPP